MQIKSARGWGGGEVSRSTPPTSPSCLYNIQVDMIGIRDSNPKQISPTGSSWLGREPENDNGSTQAAMLQRKQIGENVSEGYFVLVRGGAMSKNMHTSHQYTFLSVYSPPDPLSLSRKHISFPDDARYHMCRYLAGLLEGCSISI